MGEGPLEHVDFALSLVRQDRVLNRVRDVAQVPDQRLQVIARWTYMASIKIIKDKKIWYGEWGAQEIELTEFLWPAKVATGSIGTLMSKIITSLLSIIMVAK